MPDRLYLSYWIRGFNALGMLGHFEKMLRAFPFSAREGSTCVLQIQPLDLGGAPLLERAFEAPVDPTQVIAAAREFQHDDYAYQVDALWDLWEWDNDWMVTPARASLFCFGPQFESINGENLMVDFGPEARFLPHPEALGGLQPVQSNIRSLLHLTHELDRVLPADRRQLWSESGENFAGKLEAALKGTA